MAPLGARGHGRAVPITLCAWHKHSSACRGRSAGRHLRPVLVGSFYALPRTSLATASNEGRQEGRSHSGAVPAAGCALHDPSPACSGRWAVLGTAVLGNACLLGWRILLLK